MWDAYTKKIDLTFLPSLASTDIGKGKEELPWSTIVSMFSKHDVRQHKDGMAFMPVIFKPQSQWIKSIKEGEDHYRIDQNINAVSLAVFDLDEEGAMEQAEKAFSGFEYVMYTTHSYSKETPYKARILVKLEDPIPALQWNDFLWEIAQSIRIDEMCKNLSRNYLMPSVNPNSGMEPIFKHNSGRSLSISSAKDIAKNFPMAMTDDERDLIDRRFGKKNTQYIENKHFSGVSVNFFDRIGSSKAYDFESLTNRHKRAIDDLSLTDKRHAFARDVIAGEIKASGLNVDWHNVVQFLYKTTRTTGSKWLQHGNTPDEINDLLISGYRKFRADLLASEPSYISDVTKILEAAKQQAAGAMTTNQWVFNANPVDEVSLEVGNAFDNNQFNYDAMSDRHKSVAYNLYVDGCVTDFVSEVFESELSRFGERADLNSIAQYALLTASNYIKKSGKKLDDYSDEFGAMLTGGLEIDYSDSVDMNKVAQTKQFMQTALFLGYQCVLGNKQWDLKRDPNRNKESNSPTI
ncbi:hypothetical protein LMH73_018850 [Vibrio splendidus]|nr:hypothetical protein [Vibrio splendidus]MCC4882990.1 hypothetical protein [Vibrio splendidus]